jgi:hypothetical protein
VLKAHATNPSPLICCDYSIIESTYNPPPLICHTDILLSSKAPPLNGLGTRQWHQPLSICTSKLQNAKAQDIKSSKSLDNDKYLYSKLVLGQPHTSHLKNVTSHDMRISIIYFQLTNHIDTSTTYIDHTELQHIIKFWYIGLPKQEKDDFGIKYIGGENAKHFMTSIKKKYAISSDRTGSAYCGLKLDWDYANVTIDLYMHRYINSALHKYQHPAPIRAEQAPHQWNPPVYGAKTQYVEDREDSPALSPKDVNHLQQLVGTLLYYARAVHPAFIMTVNV